MEVVYTSWREFSVETFNKFRVLQGCEEKEIEPLRALPALLRTDAFLQVPEDFEWNRLQPVWF